MSTLRDYTAILIAHPELNEEAVLKLQAQLGELVARQGGQVLQNVSLGKRKLSYKIGKWSEGVYLQVQLKLPPSAVAELKRTSSLIESVLRLLLVQETVPAMAERTPPIVDSPSFPPERTADPPRFVAEIDDRP